ncbi:helix-turn-helix transcriptional regulator [Haloterrigena salinisoli]|uniref:helix-turn-helix transcriptional regulator n=1 Tax=Haloterrigena salinisoli TaxID=3132747 RepID=UPI0030D23474
MENNLKVWRAKADVTQAELADEVDVSRQTINAIERGRYDPSLELAFELARYFDCRIEDIFTYDPEDGD